MPFYLLCVLDNGIVNKQFHTINVLLHANGLFNMILKFFSRTIEIDFYAGRINVKHNGQFKMSGSIVVKQQKVET